MFDPDKPEKEIPQIPTPPPQIINEEDEVDNYNKRMREDLDFYEQELYAPDAKGEPAPEDA